MVPHREPSLDSAPVPHIQLPEGLPGITSGFAFRPETAKPLRELAETLLRGPNSLTSGEREMIAAFVSSLNDCHFCQASHSAAAAHHLDGNYTLVDAVKCDLLRSAHRPAGQHRPNRRPARRPADVRGHAALRDQGTLMKNRAHLARFRGDDFSQLDHPRGVGNTFW